MTVYAKVKVYDSLCATAYGLACEKDSEYETPYAMVCAMACEKATAYG